MLLLLSSLQQAHMPGDKKQTPSFCGRCVRERADKFENPAAVKRNVDRHRWAARGRVVLRNPQTTSLKSSSSSLPPKSTCPHCMAAPLFLYSLCLPPANPRTSARDRPPFPLSVLAHATPFSHVQFRLPLFLFLQGPFLLFPLRKVGGDRLLL